MAHVMHPQQGRCAFSLSPDSVDAPFALLNLRNGYAYLNSLSFSPKIDRFSWDLLNWKNSSDGVQVD